jgi:hypothetical protein
MGIARVTLSDSWSLLLEKFTSTDSMIWPTLVKVANDHSVYLVGF